MISVYKGQLSPSVTDTISVDNTPVNLTGATVTFNMRLTTSSTVQLSHAATITSPTTGQVQYNWNSGDTNTPGQYAFWWTITPSGGTAQDTPESNLEIIEHVPVTSSSLCTVADVRTMMEIPEGNTSMDDMIEAYIDVASVQIMREYKREFAPNSGPGVTRNFITLPNSNYVPFSPFDLQAGSSIGSSTVTAALLHPGDTNRTLDPAIDINLQPTVNSEGVYTGLTISPFVPLVSQISLRYGYCVIALTATWGFKTVPSNVKRAAVIAVASWVRRDMSSYANQVDIGPGIGDSSLQPQTPGTYALPAASRRLLEPYRRELPAA